MTLLSLAVISCAGKNNKVEINDCRNTFIVSDNIYLYLFEHDKNSTDFTLRKSYVSRNTIGQASYYCDTGFIVSTYLYKGPAHNIAGVSILDLDENKAAEYDIRDGSGDFLRYKNGILFNSQLIHIEPIDPALGFMARSEYTPWKNGEKLIVPEHIFINMNFFDFDKRKVTASYRLNQAWRQWIRGDTMISELGETYVEIDLKTGRRSLLYSQVDEEKKINYLPRISAQIMVGTTMYLFTSPDSWNVQHDRYTHELIGYEKNTLYKLVDGQFQKLITIPYPDSSYAVAKDEDVYIFTHKSGKVIKYNTRTNTSTEYDFDTGGRPVMAVNFTDDNFIVLLEMNHGERGAWLVLANKDFSVVGKPYELKTLAPGMTSITTNQNEYEHDRYSFHSL